MASSEAGSIAAITGRIDTEKARITGTEPEEIYRIRTGHFPHGPGSLGQYFSSWDLAAGILRDYCQYTLYPLLRMARNRAFDPAEFVTLMEELEAPGSRFLGFFGMTFLENAAAELRSALSRDASEVDKALTSLTAYANRLNGWSFHYFPWEIGEQFPYVAEDAPSHSDSAARGANTPEPEGPTIVLTWQPLGISLRATLAAAQNRELCDELMAALPFTILQDHSSVSGESIFAWTPIVSTAPVPVRERICDAPVGRLRFQQASGQKIVVAYGQTRETAMAPVLGQVHPEDVPALPSVGKAVAECTFRSKELIWLTVSS